MPTINNSTIKATEQGVAFVLNLDQPIPQGGLNGSVHVKLYVLNISQDSVSEITINGPITESLHTILLPVGGWGSSSLPASYNLRFSIKVNADPEVNIPVTVTRQAGTFEVTVPPSA